MTELTQIITKARTIGELSENKELRALISVFVEYLTTQEKARKKELGFVASGDEKSE